jgi:hypothetical protein
LQRLRIRIESNLVCQVRRRLRQDASPTLQWLWIRVKGRLLREVRHKLRPDSGAPVQWLRVRVEGDVLREVRPLGLTRGLRRPIPAHRLGLKQHRLHSSILQIWRETMPIQDALYRHLDLGLRRLAERPVN